MKSKAGGCELEGCGGVEALGWLVKEGDWKEWTDDFNFEGDTIGGAVVSQILTGGYFEILLCAVVKSRDRQDCS